MSPTSEKVDFRNKAGLELSGRLEFPSGKPHAYAVFAHCFTGSKDHVAASRISRALAKHGFCILRFDFTGLGNSDGDFANTNFSSNVEDLIAAADFLAAEHQAPKLLIGHSLGGSAVLMAAPRIASVNSVVTIGAPAKAAHVVKNFGADLAKIHTQGEAEVTLAGRKFTIRKQFLQDLEEQEHEETLAALDASLLIFHSPQDTIVEVDNAGEIYRQARHPKSFISLDGADHLLSNKEDAQYVADTIAAWATRYIEND